MPSDLAYTYAVGVEVWDGMDDLYENEQEPLGQESPSSGGRLSTMLVVAVLALLLFTIGAFATVGAVQRDQDVRQSALQEARLLAREALSFMAYLDEGDVAEDRMGFAQPDGGVRLHLVNMGKTGAEEPDSFELEALNDLRQGAIESFDVAPFAGGVSLRYVAPCFGGSYAVSVVVPITGYEEIHGEVFRSYIGLFIVLAIELVLCIVVALHKLVSRPLAQLSRAAQEVGEGDLGGKLGFGVAFGEVAKLKRDLNVMEAKLKESHDQLEARVLERTSELEEANRRLKEEVEYKTTFLSTMSHELRTPLASINAYADVWLRSGEARTEEDVKLIQGIKRNSKNLLETINNTLDAASIEANRFTLDPVPTDLFDVVNAVDSVADPLAREKGVVWTVEADESLPLVTVDPDVLHKITMNLVGNAIKFTDAGGRVRLRLEADETARLLRLEVADSGIGIPAEDLSTIFERFRQADSSISRKYGGSGLGLSLVREMSELMGGSIDVRSTVGEGSVFTVTLPYETVEGE